MKKHLIEILKIVWRYGRLPGGEKLGNTCLSALVFPAETILFQKVADDILHLLNQSRAVPEMYMNFGMFLAVLFSEVILTALDHRIELRFEMQMTDRLEKDIIQKYKKLDYGCYENSLTYDRIARISENPAGRIRDIYWKLMEMLRILISLAGLLFIYSRASAVLVLLFAGLLPPMLFENYQAGSLWHDLYERQTTGERRTSYYERLLTSKTSLIELKLYQAIGYVKRLWEKQNEKMLHEKDETLQNVEQALLKKSLFAVLWYIFSTGLLVYRVTAGFISTGMFLTLFHTTLRIADTITGLLETFGNFSGEIMEISYIEAFFALKETEVRTGRICGPVYRIRFEHVHFSYPGSEKEVLRDANFEIDLTRSTAIVGINGSGKTTIIQLLCGFYRPTKGRILLDDRDLNELDSREIGNAFQVVFQDFFQYELTVRENIGFGNLREMNCDEKLIRALDCVRLEQVRELGLDQPLGKLEEKGTDLSRGQWQRLAVSRLLLDEKKFAILDEPAASMDPAAEYRMNELFYSLMRTGGSLMISHRLMSAKMADHILVLKDGTIREQGTHDELMELGGEYHRLFYGGKKWENYFYVPCGISAGSRHGHL